MNYVILKNILIADVDEKKATFQKFIKGLNIITSKNNTKGKSCLMKSIYYCFGAESKYDNKWCKKNKIIVINFEFDNNKYKISRYNKKYLIFKNNTLIESTKSISKLSNSFRNIFNFSIYLKSKKDKNGNCNYIIAPPAFTLLPFYIDQDKRDIIFEPFENLSQFDKKERNESLYYHLGIYNEEFISLENKYNEVIDNINNYNEQLLYLKNTKNILDTQSNSMIADIENVADIENNLSFYQNEFEDIIDHLSKSRNNIQKLKSTITKYYNKLSYFKKNKIDKNTFNDNVTICPNCGYKIENIELILRKEYSIANYNIIKEQIEIFIKDAKIELEEEENNYLKLYNKLKSLENTISNNHNNFETYTIMKGTKTIKNNIDNDINKLNDTINIKSSQKKYIKNQLKIINSNKKNANEVFKNTFKKLSQESNIKSLIEYNPEKISLTNNNSIPSGFGENAFLIIMHISLILTMNEINHNFLMFPFLIDSPRSNEASDNNSYNILKLLTSKNDIIPQIIISTVDIKKYYNINDNDNLIELDENDYLLNENFYLSNEKEINEIKDLMEKIN